MKYILTVIAILLACIVHAQTDSVYTKVQITASFPAGPEVRKMFFNKYRLKVVADSTANTAVLTFLVTKNETKDLTIVNAAAIDSYLKRLVEKAIKNFPRYNPAVLNGQLVTTRVTLYLEEAD